MNRKRPSQERDLFGQPVRRPLPLRKIVQRPAGRGFAVAVRQPDSLSYVYHGVYATQGEAAQAIRNGLGLPTRDRETLLLRVKIQRTR